MYIIVKIVSRLLCLLPESISRSIGQVLGGLCWLLVPTKRRRMAIDNIKRCLKLEQQAATIIAKKSAARFGRMFVEVMRFPLLTPRTLATKAVIEGKKNLEEALSYGRGAIIATAHSGNWELLGGVLAMHGFPIVGVAQKQTNSEMDKLINEYRTLVGIHVTYKTGVREMVRMLADGYAIGLLMDQTAGDKGTFVQFFDRPSSTAPGAATLARMKDAPIVPIFITENEEGVHTVIVHPIVWVPKTEHRESDILSCTQTLTDIIEKHIRQYPTEWFWLHNRWKNSPPI